MTEVSVSFAGNLTADPQVRYTEAGIARAIFRVAVSGRREQGAGAIVLHRGGVARPGRACQPVRSKGSRVVVESCVQHRSWTAEDADAEL